MPLMPEDKSIAHLVTLGHSQEWIALTAEREPRILRSICEHGWYVGHNRVFEAKCPFCSGEKEVPEGFVTTHPCPPAPRPVKESE